MQAELLEKEGRLYEIGDFDNKKREKLGLPEIHSEKSVIGEIFKISGLKEILEKEAADGV